MMRNISYTNPVLDAEIDSLVGAPFSILKRIKMGGVGSQRMVIEEASAEIGAFLALQRNNIHYCSLELRPRGVIARFRALLETHAWVIPFHQLSIFRSGESYSIHSGGNYLRVSGLNGHSPDHKFMRRILEQKMSG
jgi:hypothetical protein